MSLNAPAQSISAVNRVNCKYNAAVIRTADHKDRERSLLSEPRILSPERAAWHPVTCLVVFLIHLFISTRSQERRRVGGGGQQVQQGGSRSLGLCLREADEGAHRLSGLSPGNVSSKIGAAAWHKDLRKREDSPVTGARPLEEVREARSRQHFLRWLRTWPGDAPGILLLLGVRLCLAPSLAAETHTCKMQLVEQNQSRVVQGRLQG